MGRASKAFIGFGMIVLLFQGNIFSCYAQQKQHKLDITAIEQVTRI